MFNKQLRNARNIDVYALVGKAGTGKSFRARLLMEKYGIDLMVDDGLLIHDQHIIAGRSAKREQNRFKAVKRAVFQYEDHRIEVRDAIRKEKSRKILLLGTSEHMVGLIAERLELPVPGTLIYIQDIATTDEIDRAQRSRKVHGKHVIPLPVVEVKQHYSHRILDTIRFGLESKAWFFRKPKTVEKTIVQPPFGRLGRISISEAALSQMIMHCIEEQAEDADILKLIIEPSPSGYRIEALLRCPHHTILPQTLYNLQQYTVSHVTKYSGIEIKSLDLTVEEMKEDDEAS
ncbi:hypothetical protein JXO52_07820 [bacterium]|nr:hypothetical protein [bacterium]